MPLAEPSIAGPKRIYWKPVLETHPDWKVLTCAESGNNGVGGGNGGCVIDPLTGLCIPGNPGKP